HVTNRRNRTAGEHGEQGKRDDGDKRRRHYPRDQREEVDDGKADEHHKVDAGTDPDQMRQLRDEDEDGQGVDEADHHGLGHELHVTPEFEKPEHYLDDTRQDGRSEQVLEPVIADQRHHQQGHGSGGRADHGGTSTSESQHDGYAEARVKADLGVDPGDDAEADRLWYQRQCHDDPGEHVTANVAEPLGAHPGAYGWGGLQDSLAPSQKVGAQHTLHRQLTEPTLTALPIRFRFY